MNRQANKSLCDASRANYWEAVIADWKQSCLSKQKFCELKKISLTALYSWIKKLPSSTPVQSEASTTKMSTSRSESVDFLPVTTSSDLKDDTTSTSEFCLRINLPNGLDVSVEINGGALELVNYIRQLKEL